MSNETLIPASAANEALAGLITEIRAAMADAISAAARARDALDAIGDRPAELDQAARLIERVIGHALAGDDVATTITTVTTARTEAPRAE